MGQKRDMQDQIVQLTDRLKEVEKMYVFINFNCLCDCFIKYKTVGIDKLIFVTLLLNIRWLRLLNLLSVQN